MTAALKMITTANDAGLKMITTAYDSCFKDGYNSKWQLV